MLATGQTNPIKLMMQKDHDLSLEDATKEYEDNLAFRKQTTQAGTETDPLDEVLLGK